MIRIITIPEEDIIIDPEEAGRLADRTVRRIGNLRFTGLCPAAGDILLVFETCENEEEADPHGPGEHFIFSPLPSASTDELAVCFGQRWAAGYSTLGTFFLNKALWGLFRGPVREDSD